MIVSLGQGLLRPAAVYEKPLRKIALGPDPVCSIACIAHKNSIRAMPKTMGEYAMPWNAVTQRFSRFLGDLQITADQQSDALTKFANVGAVLQNSYYSSQPPLGSRLLVGSWGKGTQVRPSHDLDLFFILPIEEKQRFDARTGNIQSQLLQEVKQVLTSAYNQTDIRGDGQVVVVQFNTIALEVVPAFRFGDTFQIPDTHDGGRWKAADPWAEIDRIDQADRLFGGNVRSLCKIMKHWKREQNVPLPSFAIEQLVTDFLRNVSYGGGKSAFWFDWYSRDALAYFCAKANSYLVLPGTNELFWLGDAWLSRAKTAYGHALKACEWEQYDFDVTAGQEWQKIFGTRIPLRA